VGAIFNCEKFVVVPISRLIRILNDEDDRTRKQRCTDRLEETVVQGRCENRGQALADFRFFRAKNRKCSVIE